MEMQTQKFLRARTNPETALEELNKYYAIDHTINHDKSLVILNYCQIKSVKTNPYVMECRALTLEYGTWDVVARSFPRFFNVGEALEVTGKFNWNNFTCYSKEDGSLVTLYNYKGEWKANTRGSFGEGQVGYSGFTWKDLIFSALSKEGLDWLSEECTYVMELVSPYNKVVRHYPEPSLFLLTIVDNKSGTEYSVSVCDKAAEVLEVKRPDIYKINSQGDLEKFLKEHPDATFEGAVCHDGEMRVKAKNPEYVILHKMRGNGDDIFRPKNLVPFILKEEGEESELFAYFGEVKPYFYKYKKKIDSAFHQLDKLWSKVENISNQKSFALAVKDSPFSSVLFTARKLGKHPKEVWKDSAELILKKLQLEEKYEVTRSAQ